MKSILILICILTFSGYSMANNNEKKHVGASSNIIFEEGSSILKVESVTKLETLMKNSARNGKIHEIQIVSWSDNLIPDNDKELSHTDQKLAEQRANVVRDFF